MRSWALVRNIEATARADAHLAHRIGKALDSAYHGTLDAPFTDKGDLARVTWRR